jgi:hypothetical protein
MNRSSLGVDCRLSVPGCILGNHNTMAGDSSDSPQL